MIIGSAYKRSGIGLRPISKTIQFARSSFDLQKNTFGPAHAQQARRGCLRMAAGMPPLHTESVRHMADRAPACRMALSNRSPACVLSSHSSYLPPR